MQPVSVDMSDWIRFWQMAEKQRYRVNVFPPACSAAEPQEGVWGWGGGVNKQDDSFASYAASKQYAIQSNNSGSV